VAEYLVKNRGYFSTKSVSDGIWLKNQAFFQLFRRGGIKNESVFLGKALEYALILY
jgi:hypothetical protein